jgi:hypothetical protein
MPFKVFLGFEGPVEGNSSRLSPKIQEEQKRYSVSKLQNFFNFRILSRKEGSLFVLYLWDPPNWDASDHVLGLFGKLSMRKGCMGLVRQLDFQCKSSWNFLSLWAFFSFFLLGGGVGGCSKCSTKLLVMLYNLDSLPKCKLL